MNPIATYPFNRYTKSIDYPGVGKIIVDTGFQSSVMTTATMKLLKDAGAKCHKRWKYSVIVDCGGHRSEALPFYNLDFQLGNRVFPKQPFILGWGGDTFNIIGASLLKKCVVEVKADVLKFRDQVPKRYKKEIPLTLGNDEYYTKIKVRDEWVDCFVDTGCASPLTLPLEMHTSDPDAVLDEGNWTFGDLTEHYDTYVSKYLRFMVGDITAVATKVSYHKPFNCPYIINPFLLFDYKDFVIDLGRNRILL